MKFQIYCCSTCDIFFRRRYDKSKYLFFNLQALSERQEQLWNVCTVSAGIALINLCGLGMMSNIFFLQVCRVVNFHVGN
jgi:hypothetical protein